MKFRVALDMRPVVEVYADTEEEAQERAIQEMYLLARRVVRLGTVSRVVDWHVVNAPVTVEKVS